jgi:hypothetical protein
MSHIGANKILFPFWLLSDNIDLAPDLQIYRVDKKNDISATVRYYCIMLSSFTVNYRIVASPIVLQHQKQNTNSKTAMPHTPDAMAPGKDT